jgi:Septum formation
VLATALAVLLGLPSPGQAAAPAKPRTGQCHQLTYRQSWATSDAKKPVSCTKRHNLQTIAVVTSPTSLDGLTEDQRSELAVSVCRPKLAKVLGRTATVREQTAWSDWFFIPTDAQIAAGARWIRCDLGLLASGRAAGLPHKRLSRSVIGSHIESSERRCLTAKTWVTPCSHKHAYRSIAAFTIHQSAYPTAADVVPNAKRACPKTWDYARWPTEYGWAHGNRVAVCYDKTKH